MERFDGVIPKDHVAFCLINDKVQKRPIPTYHKSVIGEDGKPIKDFTYGNAVSRTAVVMRDKTERVTYKAVSFFEFSTMLFFHKDSEECKFLKLSPYNVDSPTARLESTGNWKTPIESANTISRYMFYMVDQEARAKEAIKRQSVFAKATSLFHSQIATFEDDELKFKGAMGDPTLKKRGRTSYEAKEGYELVKQVYLLLLPSGNALRSMSFDDQIDVHDMAFQILEVIGNDATQAQLFIDIISKNKNLREADYQIQAALAKGIITIDADNKLYYKNVYIGTEQGVVAALADTTNPASEPIVKAWAAVKIDLES